MILTLGLGEPSWVPDGFLGTATDQCDLQSVAFLQCYVHEFLQWDIICYFTAYREEWRELVDMAAELEQPIERLAVALGTLSEKRLLDERILATGPVYRLTQEPELRRSAVRTALKWTAGAAPSD